MTTTSDLQDFTTGVTRLMQPAAQSPITGAGVGWKAGAATIPAWANSVQILVVLPTGVTTLQVLGAASGFTYLSAAPILDGGLYYCPVVSLVDTQLNFSYYQNTLANVSIYVILSDEPISIATLNPISATESFVEHQDPLSPYVCAANATTITTVTIDVNTKAVRCSFSRPNFVTWGKIVGTQTGTVYYDGSASNASIPVSPVLVDSTNDTSVDISVAVAPAGSTLLYVSSVNIPDFGGQNKITQPMAPNTLAVPKENADIPNQFPVTMDATIAASSFNGLLATVAGRQYRLHGLAVLQYTATATAFDLEDSLLNKFFHYHYGAAMNSIYIPLFGQLAAPGAGIRVRNTTAVLSGALALTLWHSVL